MQRMPLVVSAICLMGRGLVKDLTEFIFSSKLLSYCFYRENFQLIYKKYYGILCLIEGLLPIACAEDSNTSPLLRISKINRK